MVPGEELAGTVTMILRVFGRFGHLARTRWDFGRFACVMGGGAMRVGGSRICVVCYLVEEDVVLEGGALLWA